MNKRRWIFVLLLILILALAFLGPWLLLRREQQNILQEIRRLDAAAWQLETESGELLKRLSVLNDPASQSILFSTELSDRRAAQQALRSELTRLTELGIIPALLREQVLPEAEAMEFERLCIVNPERAVLFELYQLNLSWQDFTVLLDKSSGKILSLSYSMEAAEIQLKALMEQKDEGWAAVLAEAWAVYYGAEAELQSVMPLPELTEALRNPFDYRRDCLLRLTLRDPAGSRAVLALHCVSEYYPRCFWSGEPAE